MRLDNSQSPDQRLLLSSSRDDQRPPQSRYLSSCSIRPQRLLGLIYGIEEAVSLSN